MNTFLHKKLLSALLILFVVFSLSLNPKKAEAQWAVIDPVNLVQNVLSTISQYGSQMLAYSDNYKEYVLDPLVSIMAEMLIQQMTASVVNWINSGFEGSPSFIQNPGAFFLDIADQTTGAFIGQDLADLCSPFSIDLRIALSFKYRPSAQKRYACTLSTIISNSKDAIENASINGFTAGDFKQGGWPAFVSLTTEPQNNIYGAYIQADSDLSFRVASKQVQQKDELNQGKGFLSWRNCDGITQSSPTPINGGTYDELTGRFVVSGDDIVDKSICPVSTPGSSIANILEKQLDIPVEKLGLADEIGEIVNALFAQLATQVLQQGLSGVSNRGSSGKSYLDSVTASINQDNSPMVESARNDILKKIDKEIETTLRYVKHKENSLNTVLSIKTTFETAKMCYLTKINNSVPPLTPEQIETGNEEIAAIDADLTSSSFTSLYSQVQLSYATANEKYIKLTELKTKAVAAKTVLEINTAAQEFGLLISSLITEVDIQAALEEYTKIQSDTRALATKANTAVTKCQAFPPPDRNSGR
jgi:hypothetical protein